MIVVDAIDFAWSDASRNSMLPGPFLARYRKPGAA